MTDLARGSTFETDFREVNGRAPTSEETKRYLAFDRLAKTSSLDPLTLAMIVGEMRGTEPVPLAVLSRSEPQGWRWPTYLVTGGGIVLAFALVSFSAAVGQWSIDAGRCNTLGTIIAYPRVPWLGAAGATVRSWPVLPWVIASAVLAISLVVLAIRKSGPSTVKLWPR